MNVHTGPQGASRDIFVVDEYTTDTEPLKEHNTDEYGDNGA
jgi:hypothetical protein